MQTDERTELLHEKHIFNSFYTFTLILLFSAINVSCTVNTFFDTVRTFKCFLMSPAYHTRACGQGHFVSKIRVANGTTIKYLDVKYMSVRDWRTADGHARTNSAYQLYTVSSYSATSTDQKEYLYCNGTNDSSTSADTVDPTFIQQQFEATTTYLSIVVASNNLVIIIDVWLVSSAKILR